VGISHACVCMCVYEDLQLQIQFLSRNTDIQVFWPFIFLCISFASGVFLGINQFYSNFCNILMTFKFIKFVVMSSASVLVLFICICSLPSDLFLWQFYHFINPCKKQTLGFLSISMIHLFSVLLISLFLKFISCFLDIIF
jgi:hypothetical protein